LQLAGIGDQLANFLNGGGLGNYAKTTLVIVGVALILYALYNGVRHFFSSPPRIGKAVLEGIVLIVVAVAFLISPFRTGVLNGAGNLANSLIGTHWGQGALPAHTRTIPPEQATSLTISVPIGINLER